MHDLAAAGDERHGAGYLVSVDNVLDERADPLEPLGGHAYRLGLGDRKVVIGERMHRG